MLWDAAQASQGMHSPRLRLSLWASLTALGIPPLSHKELYMITVSS